MARVIISAGHSPVDKGAVVGDLVEYDLTRNIVDALEPLLAKYPKLETKRMPEGLSLPQKIQWINGTGYTAENNDIAVEVHINDADGTEDGVECWYAERGENASWDLSSKVMNNVCAEADLRKRKVNSEYDHQFRRLGYVHNTKTISSLIEIGFMDHPKDKKILTTKSGVKKIAQGILKGILEYFGLKEGDFDKDPIAKPTLPIHTEPDSISFPSMMPNFPMSGMPGMPGMVQPSSISAPTTPSLNPPSNLTPDEKKQMLTRLYQKVLGRNPDPKGLNYYSNSQMSEEALMKLMIDSKEHKAVVKAAKDYVTTKSELNRAESEIKHLKSSLADKEEEIETLRSYFADKKFVDSDETDTSELSEESEDQMVFDGIVVSKDDQFPGNNVSGGNSNKRSKSNNNIGKKRLPDNMKSPAKPSGILKFMFKVLDKIADTILK